MFHAAIDLRVKVCCNLNGLEGYNLRLKLALLARGLIQCRSSSTPKEVCLTEPFELLIDHWVCQLPARSRTAKPFQK